MKTFLKRAICFIIASMMFCSSIYAASSENTSDYNDITKDFWAYKHINTCTQNNWLNGYPNGSFMPDGPVTRAEAIKTLVLYLKRETTSQDGEWYAPYLDVANDIIPKEWTGENLLPDESITREELSYLLVSALGYDAVDNYEKFDKFTDSSDVSEAFKPYLASAVKNGLILGHDSGEIAPKDNLTRAELATLLCRAESLKEIRKNIENIVEIRASADENGLCVSKTSQYFKTEITVPSTGYYNMDIGYKTDNWVGYVYVYADTFGDGYQAYLQYLPHGQTRRTFLLYLNAGKNTVSVTGYTKDTYITHFKCMGIETEFKYEITPKRDVLLIDNQKQLRTIIKTYDDKLIKVETSDGVNIPFEETKLVLFPTTRPNKDIFLSKEAVYGLGEGEYTLLYKLESGKVLEQKIEIKNTAPEAKLQYIHFNVGKANSTLYTLPNGKHLLIDSATNAMAESKVMPYLEKNNIKLDYYLITHFHKDHIGLKDEIIAKYGLTVPDADKVTENLKADKETRYNYLKDFTYLDSTMLCHYDELDKIWDMGGIDVDILNSQFNENGDKVEVYKYPFIKHNDHNFENATSVSFMLDYNGFRYYHGADNYAYCQERYMSDMIKANRADELNCHWFFANHHFILDYSPVFINTLNPVAVYVSNNIEALTGLYEKYYKQEVEDYYFSTKRLQDTLISNQAGSVKVSVNSADDWYYESIQDEDLFK